MLQILWAQQTNGQHQQIGKSIFPNQEENSQIQEIANIEYLYFERDVYEIKTK